MLGQKHSRANKFDRNHPCLGNLKGDFGYNKEESDTCDRITQPYSILPNEQSCTTLPYLPNKHATHSINYQISIPFTFIFQNICQEQ